MRALTAEQQHCLDDIVNFGEQSISYFHLQNGLEHRFFNQGFVSFMKNRRAFGLGGLLSPRFYLGNPVAPREDHFEIFGEIIEETRGRAVFMQLDEQAGSELNRHGYDVNILGTDTHLDLPDYRITASRNPQLRKNINRHCKAGAVVLERSMTEIDREALLHLSRSWREQHPVRSRELAFLTMPPVYDDEIGVRKFFGFSADGELRGCCFFTPVYSEGRIKGYTLNIMRDYRDGMWDYIVSHAITRFRDEGVERLYLAFIPMHGVKREETFKQHNQRFKKYVSIIYDRAGRFYRFSGLARHKNYYAPHEDLAYVGLPRSSPAWLLLNGFNLCGVI